MSWPALLPCLALALLPAAPAAAGPPAWSGAEAPSPAAAGRISDIVAEHGRLRVVGNRVVDAKGRPLTLRGMSLFWSNARPAFYNADAIRWIAADWNATAVRAAIAAAEQDPETQLLLARRAIDAAIGAGIYVVVDWHAHKPMPDRAERFFTAIARQYRGVPNLIYETWNEPLPEHGWSTVLKPYHQRLVAAIRREDPGAFVVVGTRSWSQDVDEAAADPLPLPDIAYALHFYAATHRQSLRDRADLARERGAALFVTEYGLSAANGDAPLDLAEARKWWDWCEEHGISHLNWSLADKAEASAALQPGASPRGGWTEAELTTSGARVRQQLRTAPASPPAPRVKP